MGKLVIFATFVFALGCAHQHENLERSISALEDQNQVQAQGINLLNQQVDNLVRTVDGTKIREIEDYRKRAERDAAFISQTRSQSESTYQDIRKILADSQIAYNRLKNEFAEVIRSAARTLEEVKALVAELEKNRYVAQLLIKLEFLEGQLNTAVQAAEVARSNSDLAARDAERAKLSSDEAKRAAERVNEFSMLIAQLSQQIGSVQSDVSNLGLQVGSIQSETREAHERLIDLQRFVEYTKHELDHLKREVDRLERKINNPPHKGQSEKDNHDDGDKGKKDDKDK